MRIESVFTHHTANPQLINNILLALFVFVFSLSCFHFLFTMITNLCKENQTQTDLIQEYLFHVVKGKIMQA